MKWIEEAINILNMPQYKNWASETDEHEDVWYGVDEWDVNVFHTGSDYGETPYKYGIDVYTCEMNDDGHIETKDHVGTMYVTAENFNEDNVIIKYNKKENN